MNLVGSILLDMRIEDLRTRIWLGIVDSLTVNELFCATHISRINKGISAVKLRMVLIHSRAVEILSSSPTPLPIIALVSNYMEHIGTGYAKKLPMPEKKQMTIIPSVPLILNQTPAGSNACKSNICHEGLVVVDPMRDF